MHTFTEGDFQHVQAQVTFPVTLGDLEVHAGMFYRPIRVTATQQKLLVLWPIGDRQEELSEIVSSTIRTIREMPIKEMP